MLNQNTNFFAKISYVQAKPNGFEKSQQQIMIAGIRPERLDLQKKCSVSRKIYRKKSSRKNIYV